MISALFAFLIPEYASAQWTQQPMMRIDDSHIYTPLNPTGIQYSAGWDRVIGPAGEGRYLSTLSETNIPYASAIFFFKGSSIEYYSDNLPNMPDIPSSVYVSIDGLPAEVTQYPSTTAKRQLIWFMSNLDEGDHQLIISRGGGDLPEGSSISLDYYDLTYQTSTRPSVLGPGATNAPLDFLIDDGHDHITYEGSWSAMQPNTQQSFYYGGLQHTTTTPGSSLTFSFNGTAVYFFSDKRAQNGWALISVDGGEGELVSTFLEPWDDRWFSQVLCWTKTDLSDGPHTVKITHSDQEGKYVSLDFFKYTPGYSSTASPKKRPLAAIVGGSLGGAIALLLAVIACYWVHRRRSRLRPTDGGAGDQQENTESHPQLEYSRSHPVSYHSEKWSPDGPAVSGLNERSAVQPYAGLPEPQAT